MNKLLITLTLITINQALPIVDYEHTEPYVEFDWLDEDKKSLTIEFNENAPDINCYLYNGTFLIKGTCQQNTKVLTCEFIGNECKADGDNPATKFYYNLVCQEKTVTLELKDIPALLDVDDYDPYVTVALKSGSYIKYSIILLLSLLVL